MLSCPFCGNAPVMRSRWLFVRLWFVMCGVCGARSAEYRSPKDAEKAWDMRAK